MSTYTHACYLLLIFYNEQQLVIRVRNIANKLVLDTNFSIDTWDTHVQVVKKNGTNAIYSYIKHSIKFLEKLFKFYLYFQINLRYMCSVISKLYQFKNKVIKAKNLW